MKFCRTGQASLLLAGALAFQTGCLRKSNNAGAQTAGASDANTAPAAATGDGLLSVEPTDTPSGVFLHQGKPFCFSGTNN